MSKSGGYVTPIRLDPTGPELRCRSCYEFWPIDIEFWLTQRNGHVRTDRCRSCHRERSRLYQAMRRADPEYRAAGVERSRQYRAYIRRHHPDLLAAHDREVRDAAYARTAAWRERQRREDKAA